MCSLAVYLLTVGANSLTVNRFYWIKLGLYSFLYDDKSQYLPKTVLYFCKRTVLKVLCYQNIHVEKDGRHMHCIANEGHTNEKKLFKV